MLTHVAHILIKPVNNEMIAMADIMIEISWLEPKTPELKLLAIWLIVVMAKKILLTINAVKINRPELMPINLSEKLALVLVVDCCLLVEP